MNAVIYARYSPGPRQTDQSIEGQVRDCMAYAEENQIHILGVYADKHISGTDFDKRMEFNRMLHDAEKGQFEAIIVWKIDRFGRDREEIALNKIKLKRHGIRLLYAKEIIPDGPEGIILESLMEGLAEYYIADLRQKVKRGQRESALKGFAVSGQAAYGYKIVDKKYQINEKESWVVLYVFENTDSGKTATQIIADLEQLGIKNRKGGFITKSGIYAMLRNRKYIGECFYDGIAIPIPRIIPQELWDSVQLKIVKRPHSSATYKAAERYLLSCKAYCGECGSLLVGESGRGKGGTVYHYYKCAQRKRKKGSEKCSLKTVRKDDFEDFIVMHTIDDVLQDDVIDYLADKVVEIQGKNSVNQKLLQLKAALRDAEKGIKNIMKAIEEGIFTATTKQRLLELEAQVEDLKLQIAKEEMQKPDIHKEQVVYWLNLFKKGDIHDSVFRERLLDVFVHSVYVYKEKVIIAYNYSKNNNHHSVDYNPNIFRCSDINTIMRHRGFEPRTT